ncbi:hypothetical protein HanIR_Chr03g0146971 [Helianthus annuus]|nr:hypothetical protein HanIR_Chr03g0146971 [Helianthus annuus]
MGVALEEYTLVVLLGDTSNRFDRSVGKYHGSGRGPTYSRQGDRKQDKRHMFTKDSLYIMYSLTSQRICN